MPKSDRRVLYEQEIQPCLVNPEESSSWDFHYQKLLESIPASCNEEKEEIIRKRILKNFGGFQLGQDNFFCPRNDANFDHPQCNIIPNQIIVYGTDYLSLPQIRQYFSPYFVQIVRLDDSHALVQFQNQKECLEAINKCQPQQGNKVYQNFREVFTIKNKGWVQLRGYKEFFFHRKIMARFLTSIDTLTDQYQNKSKTNLFYAYSEAKRKFLEHLSLNFQSSQRGGMDIKNKRGGSRPNSRERQRQRSRSRGNSRERSREKNLCRNLRQPKCCCERIVRCCCQRNRSTSRDSRSSISSNQSLDKKFRKPAIIQQIMVKESDSKFEKYLQERRERKCEVNQRKYLQQVEPKLTETESTMKGAASSFHSSFCNHENSTIQEFEQVLDRLRLDDNEDDYSAFEIDQE